MKNLESIVRYRVINRCLRSKRLQYPSKLELKEACMEALGVNDVSDRTLEKDLYDMRSNESLGFFAPIKYHTKHKGYYYEDENYSIDNVPLTTEDFEALHFASSILSQFKDVSILKGFRGAVDKLSDALNIRKDQNNDFVHIDGLNYIPGGEHLDVLIASILEKKIVQLSYKKFGDTSPKEYNFCPYALKEFNGLWFVLGEVIEYGAIRTFALDRIQALTLKNEWFEVSPSFDVQQFVKHVYGINRGSGEIIDLVLKFNQQQASYIKTLPIHPTQTLIQETQESVTIQIQVVSNPEMMMKILSYGDSVEVVSPPQFKRDLKERIKAMMKVYNS